MTRFLQLIVPLLSGLLFGIGLILSGMTDPQRVLGFLDVFGQWNPALALVMGGAVLVSAPAFAYARRNGRTVFGLQLSLPDRRTLSRPLVIGSLLFGLGWGLSGVCPGPGLVLVTGGTWEAGLFVASMIGGMLISDLFERRRTAAAVPVSAGTQLGDCG
ncbi:MAG: hypothetical protein PHP86_12080 [Nevskiales bacterium]|nr:hypothetical protein [Nevskiales bacterium]